MKPPEIILRYLNAANEGRIDDATACFSPTAVVEDEGHTFTGSDSIRKWIDETTRKYQPQGDVLAVENIDDVVVASVRVSGNFPGSPIELEYQFTLTSEIISHLSIQ